jgi:hypothetical protein
MPYWAGSEVTMRRLTLVCISYSHKFENGPSSKIDMFF